MKRKYNKKLEITLTLMFMFVVILLIVYYNYKDFYGNYKNRGLFASVVNYKKDVNNYNNDFDMIISSDKNTMTKDFVIYNNNKYTVKYNIYLKPNNLMMNNDNCSKKIISNEFINYELANNNGRIIDLEKNNYIAFSGKLEPGEKKKIQVHIWVKKESAVNYWGKLLHLRFFYDNVKNNATLKDFLSMKVVNTSLYYKDTESAKQMYKIENDYRYIGDVSNNYLYFNCGKNSLGDCQLWRIIGICNVDVQNGKKKKLVKIVLDDVLNQSVLYNDINYEILSNKIEDVYYNSILKHFTLLSYNDYKTTFSNGVNLLCFSDVSKCNGKGSYLYSGYNEWLLGDKGKTYYIDDTGRVLTDNTLEKRYFRPVLYLKDNVLIAGGDGTIDFPYFVN